VLLARWQVPPTQESFVHGLSSLQSELATHSGAVVPTQTPDEHWSSIVNELPSLQLKPLGSARVQLSRDSLHDSAQLLSPSAPGHGLPEWTLQVPLLQLSDPLQYNPSLHTVPLALAGCVHAPLLHTSFVQVFPSSVQATVLLTRWQVPLTQESFVHGLLSLQSELATHSGAVVPTQTPDEHWSSIVNELPSLQLDPLDRPGCNCPAIRCTIRCSCCRRRRQDTDCRNGRCKFHCCSYPIRCNTIRR